jgi:uncharacterized protein (DUF488 family)
MTAPEPAGVGRITTVGHGTRQQAELVDLLQDAGVEAVADIRRYPGSRRHPHFSREAMDQWLPAAGIAYRWIAGLGGRRRVDPHSPHVGLRNEQFRAYADHMASDEFSTALEELWRFAAGRSTAVMCSESLWWRCHRRLLADHLVLVDGTEVVHLFHDGRVVAHEPTPGARLEGGSLVYGATEGALFDA